MVVTGSISEYIKKNQMRRCIYSRYSNGEIKYFHRGRWISHERFLILYPVYEYKKNNYKGENPNGRAI